MMRLLVIPAVVLTFVAASADATLVDFTGLGHSANVQIRYNGDTLNVAAGELDVTVDGDPFVAYCVDLDHHIKDVWTANIAPVTAINGGRAIAYLYDTFHNDVSTNTQGAALQVAIWEVLGDFGGTLDLNAGHFRLTDSSAIKTAAEAFLAAIPGDVGGYESLSYILKSGWDPRSQDLIAPEPGTLAMMMAGLPLFLLRRGNALIGVFRR